jgi:serine/threonine protein kinase
MQPGRLQRVEELFHAAVQLAPHLRSAYLDEVCANDPELRREVESLLNETAVMKQFMEKPVGALSLAALGIESTKSLEGRMLGHYRLGPLLGRGGMAAVYRARDTRLNRDVAIKVLHDAHILERPARKEALLLANLNDPNIASIYGIEEADGLCGLVLEFIEGETLSERIASGPLSMSMVVEIARQIAAGLQAAHAKGIIHRDLKPSNIKTTANGSVKIIDFGIAKLLRNVDNPTVPAEISNDGLVIGTVPYMSPEQALGKDINERSDIWSFGCVLYELLCGKPAFKGGTPTEIIVKIATQEPDWSGIPKFPEAISSGLTTIIRKCMQKDRELRYQSVDEISAQLQMIQQDQPLPKTADSQPNDDPVKTFVPNIRFARSVFMLAQLGYMALYGASMFYVEDIAEILGTDFEFFESWGLILTLVLAMVGIAVRTYLITAVGWRHPAAEQKFTILFPALLALDGIWAFAPLLVWRHIGWLALFGVALLVYVPFAQRTLMRSIYHSPSTATSAGRE